MSTAGQQFSIWIMSLRGTKQSPRYNRGFLWEERPLLGEGFREAHRPRARGYHTRMGTPAHRPGVLPGRGSVGAEAGRRPWSIVRRPPSRCCFVATSRCSSGREQCRRRSWPSSMVHRPSSFVCRRLLPPALHCPSSFVRLSPPACRLTNPPLSDTLDL
jgi:hypothetical protein